MAKILITTIQVNLVPILESGSTNLPELLLMKILPFGREYVNTLLLHT